MYEKRSYNNARGYTRAIQRASIRSKKRKSTNPSKTNLNLTNEKKSNIGINVSPIQCLTQSFQTSALSNPSFGTVASRFLRLKKLKSYVERFVMSYIPFYRFLKFCIGS